jgi:hypothetical protein
MQRRPPPGTVDRLALITVEGDLFRERSVRPYGHLGDTFDHPANRAFLTTHAVWPTSAEGAARTSPRRRVVIGRACPSCFRRSLARNR